MWAFTLRLNSLKKTQSWPSALMTVSIHVIPFRRSLSASVKKVKDLLRRWLSNEIDWPFSIEDFPRKL